VWESKDILLELEQRFPQSPPLLPTDEQDQQQVRNDSSVAAAAVLFTDCSQQQCMHA
jgi:glutathione S-transferase